jgi:hypothetical protein
MAACTPRLTCDQSYRMLPYMTITLDGGELKKESAPDAPAAAAPSDAPSLSLLFASLSLSLACLASYVARARPLQQHQQ